MKRAGTVLWRCVPIVLCAAVVLLTLQAVSPVEWVKLGEQAALFAAFSQSPQDNVLRLSASEEEPPTVPEETLTVPVAYTGGQYDALETSIPPKGDGGGTVSEQQLGGQQVAEYVCVKNSSGVSVDFAALLSETVSFDAADGPQVLIVHTHTTECYMSYYAGYYNADDVTRSTDNAENMVAVGAALAKELRAHGIGVIHDTTQHDHPQYTGAYTRSEQTVAAYLQAYPSIRVVLDLHRDAMMREDQTKIKPTATVDGKKAAQMMVVVGVTSSDSAPNPHTNVNLRFGLQLHRALEAANTGLMRPLYMVDARYNQHLSAGSLLIEIGTDANVLSESLYSVRLLGRELAAMLKQGHS